MLAEGTSYERDDIDTRVIQAVRCLWPVTIVFQLKIIWLNWHHIKMFCS